MNETALLYDLAVVMTAAGVAALVAHAFNQPKILGYILAGVVIGLTRHRSLSFTTKRRSRRSPIWASFS